MKVLHFFGLCLKSDFDKSQKVLLSEIKTLQEINLELVRKNETLHEEKNKLTYNFDKLINKYNENQLNSLYYKLINHCRNNRKFKALLPRWKNRLHDANNTLDNKEDEEDFNKL